MNSYFAVPNNALQIKKKIPKPNISIYLIYYTLIHISYVTLCIYTPPKLYPLFFFFHKKFSNYSSYPETQNTIILPTYGTSHPKNLNTFLKILYILPNIFSGRASSFPSIYFVTSIFLLTSSSGP